MLKQNQNYIKSKLLPTKIARVSYKESIDENQHLIELENIHDLKITADSVDFNKLMRNNATDGEIIQLIQRSISLKPKSHDFKIDEYNNAPAVDRHMSVTGG